jgi:hypothetical protein
MVTAAAMLFEFVAVVRSFDWMRGIKHAIAAAIPLVASVGIVFWLGYVDRSGSVVEFIVNPVAVHRFFWVTLLSFGPIIVVTALTIPALMSERRGLSILGALAVTSIAFYFFVNVRDHQDVYVGWRVGHFRPRRRRSSACLNTSTPGHRLSSLQWAAIAIALPLARLR